MKLKKLAAIVVALVLMILLVSCGVGNNATSGDLVTTTVDDNDDSTPTSQANITNKVAVVKSVDGDGQFTVEYYSGPADAIDDYSVINMGDYTASGTDEKLTIDENIAVCFCEDGEWYATSYDKIAVSDVLIISLDEQSEIVSVIIPTKQ